MNFGGGGGGMIGKLNHSGYGAIKFIETKNKNCLKLVTKDFVLIAVNI